MEKNWLIRSKKNLYTQIVGPVSREKILELKEAQVLSPEVELCSGNGYWFWIKESDLFERYVINEEPQEFNPISEAKIVLSVQAGTSASAGGDDVNHDITMVGGINLDELKNSSENSTPALPTQEDILPDEADLEYPDMGGGTPSLEVASSSSISSGHSDTKSDSSEMTGEHLNQKVALPDEADLEFPDMGEVSTLGHISSEDNNLKVGRSNVHSVEKSTIEQEVNNVEEEDCLEEDDHEPKKVKKRTSSAKKRKKTKGHRDRRGRHQPKRNDKLLLLFFAFIIALLLVIVYFYLKSSSLVGVMNQIIPSVQAQELATSLETKKKSLSPYGV
jgi:hypothetical protein